MEERKNEEFKPRTALQQAEQQVVSGRLRWRLEQVEEFLLRRRYPDL